MAKRSNRVLFRGHGGPHSTEPGKFRHESGYVCKWKNIPTYQRNNKMSEGGPSYKIKKHMRRIWYKKDGRARAANENSSTYDSRWLDSSSSISTSSRRSATPSPTVVERNAPLRPLKGYLLKRRNTIISQMGLANARVAYPELF